MCLQWWLGCAVYPDASSCPEPKCGALMDRFGDHAVSCPCGPSRNARHDHTNHAWCHQLKGFGFQCQREVFTDPVTFHRPADTMVENWKFGRSCAHDWVITHVHRDGALKMELLDPNWSLRRAEDSKDSHAKERCQERHLDFVPLAADTFGGFGDHAEAAIKNAVSRGKMHRGWSQDFDVGCSVKAIKQRLRVTIMKGIARQLLRRLVVIEEAIEELGDAEL